MKIQREFHFVLSFKAYRLRIYPIWLHICLSKKLLYGGIKVLCEFGFRELFHDYGSLVKFELNGKQEIGRRYYPYKTHYNKHTSKITINVIEQGWSYVKVPWLLGRECLEIKNIELETLTPWEKLDYYITKGQIYEQC